MFSFNTAYKSVVCGRPYVSIGLGLFILRITVLGYYFIQQQLCQTQTGFILITQGYSVRRLRVREPGMDRPSCMRCSIVTGLSCLNRLCNLMQFCSLQSASFLSSLKSVSYMSG